MTSPSPRYTTPSMLSHCFRGTCIEIEQDVIQGLEEQAVKIAKEQAIEEFPLSAATIAAKIIKEVRAEYNKQIEEAFKEPPPYAANSEEGRRYFSLFVNDCLPRIKLDADSQFKYIEKRRIEAIVKPILAKPKDPPSPTNYMKV